MILHMSLPTKIDSKNILMEIFYSLRLATTYSNLTNSQFVLTQKFHKNFHTLCIYINPKLLILFLVLCNIIDQGIHQGENIKQGERKNRKATFGVFKPFVETYFHPTQTLKLRGVYVHHDNMHKKRVCEWKILA